MSVFYALIEETIRSLLVVSFLLIAMYGWGAILAKLIFFQTPKHHASDVSFITLVILGALLTSQFLFYVVYCGWYSYTLVTCYKVIGVCFFLASLIRSKKPRLTFRFDYKLLLYVSLSVVLFLFFLMANNANYFIHGDARQYHLAFPWTMSITGKFFTHDTFTAIGTYLGFDILYMAVNDLSRLSTEQHSRHIISELKTFSFMGGLLFFTSIFALCHAMGGTLYASIISSLSALSVSSIVFWGTLKNDLVVAGVALHALALVITAARRKCPSQLWLSAIIAAFAITIKVTVLFPIALVFFAVILNRDFRIKDKMIVLVAGCIILLPWMMYGVQTKGTPFPEIPLSFFSPQAPPAVQAAWAERNSNGLSLNPVDFAYYLPQLILNLYPVSSNNSLGVLFLAALVYVCYEIINKFRKKQIAFNEIVVLAGLLWFLVFSLTRFEGRFLSRYILLCPGILFAYTAVQIQSRGSPGEIAPRRRIRFIAQVVLFIVIMWGVVSSDLTKRYWDALARLTKISDATFQAFREREFAEMTALYREVEQRRGNHAVAVNDSFLLFLQPPYINLHGLHAERLNLYEKDADFIKKLLEEKDVSLILFRDNISGHTPAFENYIAHYTRLLKQFEDIAIYDIDNSCSDASANKNILPEGRTIPFNECSIQKITGWSREEPWGRWTNGEWATVRFDHYEFPQTVLELLATVRGFTTPKHPEQIVDILANDVHVGTWAFVHGEDWVQRRVVLPAEVIVRQQPLTLSLHIKSPESRSAYVDGFMKDPRQLGIGIQSIGFCSVAPVPINTLLDSPISFAEESCLLRRMSGWSFPEPWGVWSDGEWAIVSFDRYAFQETQIELTAAVQGFTAENHPEQIVDIFANEIQVGRWAFNYGDGLTQRRVMLTAEVIATRQPLTLVFHIKHPASPLSLGLSGDPRQLGIGIQSIMFRKAEPSDNAHHQGDL